MKYYGKFDNKEMVVYVSGDEMDNEVVINTNGRSYDGIIKKDEKGRFFTFKKEKVYLDDLKTSSFEELVKKAKNGEQVFYLEFLQARGQENDMRFSYSAMRDGSRCKIWRASSPECLDKYKVECQEPNVKGTRNWEMTSLGIIESLKLGLVDLEPGVCA